MVKRPLKFQSNTSCHDQTPAGANKQCNLKMKENEH
jgi:hypothetical protein